MDVLAGSVALMCRCLEPLVFGHQPACPVAPQSWPSCGNTCTQEACWTRCKAWKAQATVFGWQPPEDRVAAAVEEALA